MKEYSDKLLDLHWRPCWAVRIIWCFLGRKTVSQYYLGQLSSGQREVANCRGNITTNKFSFRKVGQLKLKKWQIMTFCKHTISKITFRRKYLKSNSIVSGESFMVNIKILQRHKATDQEIVCKGKEFNATIRWLMRTQNSHLMC